MKFIAPLWLQRVLVFGATAIVAFQTYTLGITKSASVTKPIEISREATSTARLIPETRAKVTYVFDGDTIEIAGGARVRYIGMNTPELARENVKEECYAKIAADENKTLVLGKTVRLVPDVSDTDKYGRLLRYVYVDNLFINDYLTRQGYADAEPIRPDIHLAATFYAAQKEAQKHMLGLWSACPHVPRAPSP